MNRTITLAASAAATLFAAPALAQEECGEISITEMNWASASVVTQVANFILTQGYGCDVSVIPSSTNPALTSVAETGEPDVLTELWTNSAPAYARLRDEGKLVKLADVLSDGGVEGWWVPNYLVEENPELATIEGVLANPELLGGRLHQCPDGWACKSVNASLAEAAGLEEAGFEIFVHGSGETLATSIASAYESQEPWLGYYWSPTSVLGQYPMTMVDMGGTDMEAHECNAQEDCADPQLSNYPSSEVLTAVTADFVEREPAASEFLSKMSFTNAQMNEVLAWMEENAASSEEGAVYFLTSFQDNWTGWLSDGARENLQSVLASQ